MRTSIIAIALLLFFPFKVFDQIKIDTIKSIDRDKDLQFPLIRHSKPLIAQKINNYLQSNLLGNTTKKAPAGKVFDRRKFIHQDTVWQSGITFCSFIPLLNNGRLLTIQIDFEYMAAYPSGMAQYFNFNAQNGDPIIVEDIFTKKGIESLKKKVHSERIKIIDAHVAGIRKNKTEELIDEVDYIEETLRNCLEYDTLDGFAIEKDKMTFHKAECFPHARLSFGTDLDIQFSFSEISPWLNEFGKKALLTKVASIEKETKPGIMKPFYGLIGGKYPIVLQLTDVRDGLSGFYYYESQGICINLSGFLTGSTISLEESDDMGNKSGSFNGKYDGKQIIGTWTPTKGGKPLYFLLKN